METALIKRAVIYCRVSTKEQVEEGNSLVTQEKNCREYALKNGFEIVAIFIEQGESAKTADRTELKKLMSFCAVKKNNIQAIIAYKIDRISRNTDDYSQIRILLKRYGVEIKSTSEFFEDTPAGRFMENIIANVAQFDNDVRAERSTGGMKDAVREGRYVWMAPYGYSNVRVDGKSTITPNKFAPIVKRIFEEVAVSIYPVEILRKKMIAEIVDATEGKPISKSAFYRIIKNEMYTGWIEKFSERHKGNFEPLVSEELFHYVQHKLYGKKQKNKEYLFESPDFPLRRFIRHASGKMLTGGWSKGRSKSYPYYLIRKFNINIKKEVLEDSFKNWLNQFKIDIGHFDKLKTIVKQYLDSGVDNKRAKEKKLQERVMELKEKQALLVEKNIDGIISNDLCKERLAAIDSELYTVKQAISNMGVVPVNYSHALNIIRDILLNPGKVWEKADFKTKVKLQWFYFPNGIEIDNTHCRTTKICKLFKLNELISSFQYQLVNHPVSKSNTGFSQITLLYETDLTNPKKPDEFFYADIGQEIVFLSELIQTTSCISKESSAGKD